MRFDRKQENDKVGYGIGIIIAVVGPIVVDAVQKVGSAVRSVPRTLIEAVDIAGGLTPEEQLRLQASCTEHLAGSTAVTEQAQVVIPGQE